MFVSTLAGTQMSKIRWEMSRALQRYSLKKIEGTNWMQLADYFNISTHYLEEHFSRNESFNVFRAETIETWWGNIHI
jgi:hypothetical protein